VLEEAEWRELDSTGGTAVDLDTPDELAAWRARREHRRTGPRRARRPRRRVTSVRDGGAREADDVLAGEEPLQIRAAGPGQAPADVAVTLRTPGHEAELAVGFLHAEGLLAPGEVAGVEHGDPLRHARPDDTSPSTSPGRSTSTRSRPGARRPPRRAGSAARRRSRTSEVRCPRCHAGPRLAWSRAGSSSRPAAGAQEVFAATGGLHAAATADLDGDLEVVREDVGRHNAWTRWSAPTCWPGELPLTDRVLVLSGRIGFELVQKAALAGLVDRRGGRRGLRPRGAHRRGARAHPASGSSGTATPRLHRRTRVDLDAEPSPPRHLAPRWVPPARGEP
jgi:FdhD protein